MSCARCPRLALTLTLTLTPTLTLTLTLTPTPTLGEPNPQFGSGPFRLQVHSVRVEVST